MPPIKFSDLDRASRLLKQLVPKADLNGDDAIRESDVARLREHAQTHDVFQPLWGAVDGLRKSARALGGPSVENIKQTIDEAVEKLKARDKNGDRKISDTELPKRITVAEGQILEFTKAAKNKKVKDYKFPAKKEWKPGRFDYRGTAAEVCQSLLDAFSRPANDNFWPDWASRDQTSRAARYVIDRTEANAMVTALKKLYPNRQKSTLTELAARTQMGANFGCASPTDSGKTVLERYARELGLDLEFQQPGAPRLHVS